MVGHATRTLMSLVIVVVIVVGVVVVERLGRPVWEPMGEIWLWSTILGFVLPTLERKHRTHTLLVINSYQLCY